MSKFYDEQKSAATERIRIMRLKMPLFFSEFLMGVETRTTALTRLNYSYDFNQFLLFLSDSKFDGKPVRQLTLDDLKKVDTYDIELYVDYLTSHKDSRGITRRSNERAKMRHLCTIRSVFKYFFNKDKLDANIASKVSLPKLHDKEIVRLDENETFNIITLAEQGTTLTERQKKFHSFTKERDTALLSLFLGTGIRISELVGINIDDIDFTNLSFRVIRKGGNAAILYMPDEVAKSVSEYLTVRNERFKPIEQGDSSLFLSIQGKRISTRAVQDLVKKYARIVSPLKKITPHKLRSTYGTALYRKTHDIYVVAEVLGHKDVNTTKKHYAAISEDIKREASKNFVLRNKPSNNEKN